MEEDLVASLTRQVKEEVIENYLAERRLVDYQIEDLEKQADEVRRRGAKVGRRLSRLALLMVDQEMLQRLVVLLRVPQSSFWEECLEKRLARGIRFIRVRALTDKSRFRKLVLEAYCRLYQWMEKYRKSYELLDAECRAVNSNIVKFQKNFDLLSIISFLKNLDTYAVERKRFLGENFTPEEMASVDKTLYKKTVPFENLGAPPPLPLPEPQSIETPLGDLAMEVYRKHQAHIKRLML